MEKRKQDDGLTLMVRSLNDLYERFHKQMLHASPEEVEDAMYAYLHRCEKARLVLGKDWMKWFPADSRRRQPASDGRKVDGHSASRER